ncbi:ectoine/hydroxyectoine ABC transporter substrate-binding protein EhuB [Sinorhizobium sp. CCBAU 05631]|uniref:ectoine/hydroxyectoine ABC transporter substrate-binding protein EhuB n=1 Tax=Sinorhizobium sp. CCBAU 05631 TaxID=794846 RepID=UPI0004B27EFB|nr:ectoine/hydroxyectoine ABC transporter substrate-binding protein EhuB [Sinorhizobium sp. CCBAU 05631]ASY61113.1 amino acid ABC transporter, periplasmic amino acid-binding protein [Sinorhizobium sp. CCBAU 05631]
MNEQQQTKVGIVVRRAILRAMLSMGIAAVLIGSTVGAASAQSLLDKVKNGETIRIGFSNEIPWAYPGENNEPLGFVNAMTLDILKKLGTTKVEPVVTEWGSLIPGLQAGRFDIITGGMFILPERCRNVLFTEPLGRGADGLLVPNGNPKALHSYQDVRDKGLTFVTAAGYDSVKYAQEVGIPDDKIMQVGGPAEILQAVKAGRADAGAGDYFTVKKFADEDDSVELADPFTPPVTGYPAFAFLPDQQATVDAFNAVMKGYIGSEEMMRTVARYGYTKASLPDGTKTADLCRQ